VKIVYQPFPAAARMHTHLARGDIIAPQLVRPGHGDEQCAAHPRQIPGAVQRNLRAATAPYQTKALLAGAGQGSDGLHPQIDGPQRVVPRVSHIQDVPVGAQGHALGLVEAGHGVAAVHVPCLDAPDHGQDLIRVQRSHDDPVVAGIGDEQPPSLLIGQYLARKRQQCFRA